MGNSANLFNSKVLFEFFKAPSFKAALDASTRAKLQADVDHYKQISQDKIQRLSFQERAVKSACTDQEGLWSGELWTGAGKSIIAARIALHFLGRGGKVIFICPNRMGIGSASDGIIQKFHRTFNCFKVDRYRVGELDHVTRLDDVHFFTPAAFVKTSRETPAFFKKLTSEATLLIVDEAHHFPEDPKEEQVIYGKVERLASRHFTEVGKKVVTLTATHGRHDGKPVFKKKNPDFRITVSEAVQAGWCPEIHGLPVYLKIKAPKAVSSGHDYRLNFSKNERAKYLCQVAAVMLQVQKANPDQQFCVFVTSASEAVKLAEIWNREASRFGFRPLATLLSLTAIQERLRIKKDIQDGRYVGYVTCHVGSESIDIPKMECVHMVRRTRSINQLVQSVGRVLRNHPKKRRALVVDYNLSERKIIRACRGLEAYAAYVRTPSRRLVSGGPLVPIIGSKNADFSGVSLGEEKAWVERSLREDVIPEGSVFGGLTVTEYVSPGVVRCRCVCGEAYVTRRDLLLNGKRFSCGCRRNIVPIPIGKRFGRLVVLEFRNRMEIVCKCDCGNQKITNKAYLIHGNVRSCGCARLFRSVYKIGSKVRSWTILKDEGSQKVTAQCECGTIKTDQRRLFRSNASCGCHRKKWSIPFGKRFGRLTVLKDEGPKAVHCKCFCGLKKTVTRYELKRKKSCGCLRLKDVLPEHRRKVEVLSKGLRILPGSKFHWLKVLSDNGAKEVQCVCQCGRKIDAVRRKLIRSPRASCGCIAKSDALIAGKVYGLLRVVRDLGPGNVLCQCRCGREVSKSRYQIAYGYSKSCGCARGGTSIHIGYRAGKLTVLSDKGASAVKCRCDCGKVLLLKRGAITRKRHLVSCGCMGRKDHRPLRPGRKFGWWTVISGGDTGRPLCRCRCGLKKKIQRKHLYRGVSKSCGCKSRIPQVKEGTAFGRLTVLRDPGGDAKRKVLCRCKCGKVSSFRIVPLVRGEIRSCTCRKMVTVPLRRGQRFGALKVIEDRGLVECICDCGKKKLTMRNNLKSGCVKSCGHLSAPHGPLKAGAKYGFWTVVSDKGSLEVVARCQCGMVKVHARGNLRLGGTKACRTCSKKRGYSRDAS